MSGIAAGRGGLRHASVAKKQVTGRDAFLADIRARKNAPKLRKVQLRPKPKAKDPVAGGGGIVMQLMKLREDIGSDSDSEASDDDSDWDD